MKVLYIFVALILFTGCSEKEVKSPNSLESINDNVIVDSELNEEPAVTISGSDVVNITKVEEISPVSINVENLYNDWELIESTEDGTRQFIEFHHIYRFSTDKTFMYHAVDFITGEMEYSYEGTWSLNDNFITLDYNIDVTLKYEILSLNDEVFRVKLLTRNSEVIPNELIDEYELSKLKYDF